MRRFASAFSLKRDKNPPPPLLTDNAHSSASSSSGSASLYLQTPDEEQHPIEVVDRHPKKSWKSWLKLAKGQKHSQQKPWHNPATDWIHQPLPELDDTQSYPSADLQQDQRRTENSRDLFITIVENSLIPPPASSPPFACRPDSPLQFPKSLNRPKTLRHPNSLASTLFKKHLLTRLQRSDQPLTQPELQSISSLSSRRASLVASVHPLLDPFNEPAPPKATVFNLSSPGLTQWISRPCFEDRYDVFFPREDGTVSHYPVVGTALAVAALEYSSALEAMLDPEFLENGPQISALVIEIPSSSPSIPESTSTSASSSSHTRSSPYIAVPSPLRNEHNLPSPPTIDVTQSAPPNILSQVTTSAPDSLVKRGVRFAEDDKDDIIPLGYVLRMKKKREEKAKFLRAQQERRLLEEERKRIEEERHKRDLERAEWEKERRAWEKEKRVMEEEKQQRKFAEEVAAARSRRESQRAGGVPALKGSDTDSHGYLGSAGGYFPASVTSPVPERNKPSPTRRHTRPVYDNDGGASVLLPRREASEPNLPTITRTSPNAAHVPVTYPLQGSSNSHSPSSSRPGSVESSSPLPGTRSPSVHSSQEISSSSEDVKAAVARAKRNSFATSVSRNNSSGSITMDLGKSYPAWTSSNSSLHNLPMNTGMIPVVPPLPVMPMQMQMVPVPAFVMDMPLLPPTPPFMMQQYPRQQGSPGRSSRSSSKGRLSGSQNSSRERVNITNGSGSGSTDGSSRSGRPPRSSSFPRPEYHQTPTSLSTSSPGSPYNSSSRPGHGSQDGEMSSRRASMPASSPHQHLSSQRQRQSSYNGERSSNSAQSQPPSLSRGMSTQHLHPPSPWTGLPTQSGKLLNANGSMPPGRPQQSSLRGGTSKRQSMIV